MVQDEPEQTAQSKPPAGRVLVFGGVAAACALGAGLGLWARPVEGESPQVGKPAPPVAEVLPAADRRLHVVVASTPPPEKPLEVLSAPPPRALRGAAPMVPEPQAPRRPPEGLVRVDAPDPGPLALAPRPQPVRVIAQPKPAPVAAKANPAPKHVEARSLRTARADHPATAAKHERQKLAKAAAAHPPKARSHEVETADAAHEARARRAILALAHVVTRIAAHHAREEAREEARAEPPAPAHRASLHEARVTRTPAKKPPRRERYVPPLNTKDAGPIRVATVTTRCASPDPGEALTCGDPALGAAERRMNRAYREAVAAGVPAATLQQQQQRWLAARAAAAREAPWAVREVYQARIAELQDMARSAQGSN